MSYGIIENRRRFLAGEEGFQELGGIQVTSQNMNNEYIECKCRDGGKGPGF